MVRVCLEAVSFIEAWPEVQADSLRPTLGCSRALRAAAWAWVGKRSGPVDGRNPACHLTSWYGKYPRYLQDFIHPIGGWEWDSEPSTIWIYVHGFLFWKKNNAFFPNEKMCAHRFAWGFVAPKTQGLTPYEGFPSFVAGLDCGSFFRKVKKSHMWLATQLKNMSASHIFGRNWST